MQVQSCAPASIAARAGTRAPPAPHGHGLGEDRMGRPAPPRRGPVTVRITFEPTRLAEEVLRDAYRALVAAPAKQTAGPLPRTVRVPLPRVEGNER
jgi:hypothetical protein